LEEANPEEKSEVTEEEIGWKATAASRKEKGEKLFFDLRPKQWIKKWKGVRDRKGGGWAKKTNTSTLGGPRKGPKNRAGGDCNGGIGKRKAGPETFRVSTGSKEAAGLTKKGNAEKEVNGSRVRGEKESTASGREAKD